MSKIADRVYKETNWKSTPQLQKSKTRRVGKYVVDPYTGEAMYNYGRMTKRYQY